MNQSIKSLLGQRAVVTGASSGIGRAIALELARAGATLMVHARRNRQGLDETIAEIEKVGSHGTAFFCDLADPLEQRALFEQASAWAGDEGLDIWVNNAGADVLTGEPAKWSFEQKLAVLWQVDVVASLSLSRMVGQAMKSRGHGAIVNIGWDQAEIGMAGTSGELFAATKGAVMNFSRSLAKSLAPQVRVNCVAPGWIKTAWGERASDYWQERAQRESLLERWGTPDDVALAVAFLVSPAASFITGHTLPVNGGLKQPGV